MMPAAVVTCWSSSPPLGTMFFRLSLSKPCNASTMNMTSTPILIITMMALTLADSLAPRIRSSEHSTIRMTAGRLRTPPCSGAWDSDSGIVKPKRLSKSSLRYCDQPTATAAAETPYSRRRQAATPMAGSSPRVAYA